MENELLRYSVSNVIQGEHRFYTLTMPSEVLAECCFVTTREEDPKLGFQRLLDRKRASEIAKYIDSGLGTIPNSIVLSAQPDAELKIIGRGKTLEFVKHPKAFLILDGQHRVYGFSLAKSNLRVPVVIYNNLTRRDESRLFIDINSKQKGVPTELLLDIKRLAEYESDEEGFLRELFDMLNDSSDSALRNALSPAKQAKTKVSRVTFNASFKTLIPIFDGRDIDEIYEFVNSYFVAFISGLSLLGVKDTYVNSVVFRAIVSLFPVAASKVKDRYGADYNPDNFREVLSPIFMKARPSIFQKPGNSYKRLSDNLEGYIGTGFTL